MKNPTVRQLLKLSERRASQCVVQWEERCKDFSYGFDLATLDAAIEFMTDARKKIANDLN